MKKLSQLFCLSVLFITIGLSLLKAADPISTESWIISKDIEPTLEDIQANDLIVSLKDFGISAKVESFDQIIKGYTLLEGKYFTLYLAPTFYEKDQVWIMSRPDVSASFENLSSDQLIEMERFRYLMGEVYRTALGYQGYVMFMDLKKDYGLGHPTLCLEMIPTSLSGPKRDLFDIRDKIERCSYFLFATTPKKQLCPEDAKVKVEAIKAILETLQAKGHTLENQKRIAKNTLPWPRKLIYMEELKKETLQALKNELFEQQALFVTHDTKGEVLKGEAVENKDEGEFTQEIVAPIEKCAFCNPKVIESQMVYKRGDFVVLYNFRPYTLGYHFMITPYLPLHVEDWQNFSLDDVIHNDQLAQDLVREMKQESGRDDIILFVQNGMTAGMTVPHGHMHILLRPSQLHFVSQILLEISNHKRKGLTTEEMEPVKSKFSKLLK